MDHDLLMMIYGALIGLGSSIITILFQSWINRREHERQLREETRRKRQEIYLPTSEEVQAIVHGKIPPVKAEVVEVAPDILPAKLFLGILILIIICAGLAYFSFWLKYPVAYFLLAGFITFLISYVAIRYGRNI